MRPLRDITTLEALSLVDLRTEWAKHYGPPPSLRSSDLLRLVLAWRLQASAYGSLDAVTRRKLKRSGPVFAQGLDLASGTTLTREWQGKTQEVVIEKNSFRWNGDCYPSLSAVALAMTGSRRNGPRFFGLRGKVR
jgi:hypothetical protein